MNCKINSLLIVVMLASIVLIVDCNPMDDFFTQFTDETDRVLLKRLAEYFTGDESDDESSSSLSTSASLNNNKNGIKTRDDEILARAENCRLPMKRGLCRALLPRWRYDPITKTCTEFKFGGCDGNENNFKTKNECMNSCAGV